MEFWGVEVKPGEALKYEPEEDKILHLSQAALGETKKGNDNVILSVKFDEKKLVLGTLSTEKCPQVQYDLVFEKEFELSHSSKTTSVYFCGYLTLMQEDEELPYDSDEDEEDEKEVDKDIRIIKENGKPDGKGKELKSEAKAVFVPAKPKGTPSQDVKKVKKDDDDDSDGESDESDDDDELSSGDDEMDEDDSSDENDDESDEEEDESPKKPETGKKRAAETTMKTPVSDKKAKVATPSAQKTGGDKKSVHVATPHPAKQAGKTPANNDKSKQKSPKSGGSVACKSCSKTFNSENALQAHSKAKHAAK